MDIALVLSVKFEGAEWVLDGNDYSKLTWLSNTPKPTESALEALWAEVQAKLAAQAQAKIDAKASAIAKLQALGLTVQEVEVAFGLAE